MAVREYHITQARRLVRRLGMAVKVWAYGDAKPERFGHGIYAIQFAYCVGVLPTFALQYDPKDGPVPLSASIY